MKDGCVFCDYDGPSPVLEDCGEHIIFEPIAPVVPGHVLVVPKRHHEDSSASFAATGHVMECAARWGRNHARDYNLITSTGPAATQTIRHLHVHVVPRRWHDGLLLPWSEKVSSPSP